jgi:aspartyl-tRNA(Asn)/glutamyl-tRNA(Gln) amidotransferase subunit B
MAAIASVKLIVGLEVHVELACRTKVFSRAMSPACAEFDGAEPNTCLDPVVLGLPGALPTLNARAVEMSIQVGLALGCQIAPLPRWDRKSYFYADMPKGYQISQYDRPLCFDGVLEIPAPAAAADQKGGSVGVEYDAPSRRIGIIRAHLEEDAGKLLHERPGGGGSAAIDYSILDLNRAGTALLEIVTQPDFRTAEEVVVFCQSLRNICRFLGVTEGVMQKGHMRFEPNINCELTLADGRLVKTPIVEVKNLNSFKAVRGAIEFEAREQPGRWQADGREMGPGTKQTRGWDDHKLATILQREKEDAHDYRYFPDPDLLAVTIDPATVERQRQALPELPLARLRRYMSEFGLGAKEAAALSEERAVCLFYEDVVKQAEGLGVAYPRAGKRAGDLLLQSGFKRANEASGQATGDPVLVSGLGISAAACAGIVQLREEGAISAQAADELFGIFCAEPGDAGAVRAAAEKRGMILVRDDAALDAWVAAAIDANPQAAADVRAGKEAAVGRIVGAAMKLAGGKGDAGELRKRIMARLPRG